MTSLAVHPPARRRPLRLVLRELLEPYQPGTPLARWSLLVDLLLFVAIAVACAVALAPYVDPAHTRLYWRVELGVTLLFVVEYLLRWYAAPRRATYPLTPWALIDLLAIAPTLIWMTPDSLLLRGARLLRYLRFLRLLQLVRLLHLWRLGPLARLAYLRLRLGLEAANHQYRLKPLAWLGLWIVIGWALFANLLHFTEYALVGDAGPYGGYWRSYWSILVVLLSGLEDKEPLTAVGRAEVMLLMLGGICAVGTFTGQIVTTLVRRAERAGRVPLKPPGAQLSHHLLVLGVNAHLPEVLRQLHLALGNRHPVLIVDPRAEELRLGSAPVYANVYALAGDPIDGATLTAAGAARADRALVLAGPEDAADELRDGRTLMTVLALRRLNDALPIVAELCTPEALQRGAVLTSVEYVQSGRYGAQAIATALAQRRGAALLDQLIEVGAGGADLHMLPVPAELVGLSFRAAQARLFDRPAPLILLGLRPADAGFDPALVLAPGGGAAARPLAAGDQLVLLARDTPRDLALQAKEELWTGQMLSRA